MNVPDPFQYLDFRVWFRDFLVNYSYSQFIEILGLKSKGHITQILHGQKNVTTPIAVKIADEAKFQGRKREFFFALIEYTQAVDHEKKKIGLDRMLALQKEEGVSLQPLHYDLCKKWYYPVIRELVRIVPVVDQYDELARLVVPPITERAAHEAIQDLERIGLLVRNTKKRYIQTASMISFQEEWKSVVVREFQQQALDLQKKALDIYSAEEREISTATLCVSSTRAELIKRKMQEFRKEIMHLVKTDPSESEQVFQMNLGFFPLSKRVVK